MFNIEFTQSALDDLGKVDDFDQEVILAGQNQALMQFLAQRSREAGTYPLDRVRERLNLS